LERVAVALVDEQRLGPVDHAVGADEGAEARDEGRREHVVSIADGLRLERRRAARTRADRGRPWWERSSSEHDTGRSEDHGPYGSARARPEGPPPLDRGAVGQPRCNAASRSGNRGAAEGAREAPAHTLPRPAGGAAVGRGEAEARASEVTALRLTPEAEL